MLLKIRVAVKNTIMFSFFGQHPFFLRLKRLWGALMLFEWNMEYRRFAPVLIVKVS